MQHKKMIKSPIAIVFMGLCTSLLFSCQKYLDATPNKEFSTVTTMADLRALLDNPIVMSGNFPVTGAVASDDYYVTDAVYNALTNAETKSAYTWGLIQESSEPYTVWLANYKKIITANTVLDHFDGVSRSGFTEQEANAVKGEALFYRGFTLFQLSQVYALPYNKATATQTPGVPIKLTADVNEPVSRPSIEEDFNQVIKDLTASVSFLPQTNSTLLRPVKAAAYAALSNVFLIKGDYQKALSYADSALAIKSTLMNFNNFSPTTNNVIPLYNDEVIWHAEAGINTILGTSRLIVDTLLYKSYKPNDLRATIFFRRNSNGTYTLKSTYNGYPTVGVFFSGIAVDEIFLVKAECEARLGNASAALTALNTLLSKRYAKASYVPVSITDAEQLLRFILEERRKELCFRGMHRWTDVRRLNQHDEAGIILRRKLEGTVYELKTGDLHYAFLIPQNVIDNSGIAQNKR